MCNRYAWTRSPDAMRQVLRNVPEKHEALIDTMGNFVPAPHSTGRYSASGRRRIPIVPVPATLPDGVTDQLHFIEASPLWTVEEALRARRLSLVIAAPEKPISLTPGKRLQLAAEAKAPRA